MPECHRCRRVLPTAELRRTSLGHLCKDNGAGSRCWTIARDRRAPERLQLLQQELDERRAATPEDTPPISRAEASVG